VATRHRKRNRTPSGKFRARLFRFLRSVCKLFFSSVVVSPKLMEVETPNLTTDEKNNKHNYENKTNDH